MLGAQLLTSQGAWQTWPARHSRPQASCMCGKRFLASLGVQPEAVQRPQRGLRWPVRRVIRTHWAHAPRHLSLASPRPWDTECKHNCPASKRTASKWSRQEGTAGAGETRARDRGGNVAFWAACGHPSGGWESRLTLTETLATGQRGTLPLGLGRVLEICEETPGA